MDLFSSSNLILIICFTITLFVYSKRKPKQPLNLPPGPWKLPIIGSLHHLVIDGSLKHRRLKDLSSKYGPLMHLQLGEISTMIVSSPQVASEVMKTHDLVLSSRPKFLIADEVFYKSSNIAATPYGPYFIQMRKICSLELLSTKKVRSFRSIREEETWRFIESIRQKSNGLNLSEEIFSLTYKVLCNAGFGAIGHQYEERFRLLIHEVVLYSSSFNFGDMFPSFKSLDSLSGIKKTFRKLHREVDFILSDIVEQHRKKHLLKSSTTNQHRGGADADDAGEDDLVDVLLKVVEGEDLDIPMSTDNIKAVLLDIFVGGLDSSSTVLEWTMSELIKNPKAMKKAQDELRRSFKGKQVIFENDIQDMTYLKLVIQESMRLHPPVPILLPRESTEYCKINGYDIPAKTKVLINAWAIGRDPQYWNDAECFIPERFENSLIQHQGKNFEYIPFGGGRRMCPGVNFGLANVELPLAQMLYHFDWKLPNEMKGEDLDMRDGFSAVCRRRNELHLIPTSYCV